MRNLKIPNNFGSNPRWISGVVEDRADPQMRGRVRVRWFGYYSTDIATEDLPWSIVVQDITSAGIGGIGTSPTGIMIGTFVLGTFLDGDDMQNPAVIGVLGPVDGILSSIAGNNPDAIMNADGIRDSGVVGPNTPSNVKFVGDGPPWFQAARGEIGTKEITSGGYNPRVLEYLKTVGLNRMDAWCSAFVAWCLKSGGASITGITAAARSNVNASCYEKIQDPLHGCVAVFSRGSDPSKGHVGFVESIQGGKIKIIGGNQSDAVNIRGIPTGRLLGYRWPAGFSKDGFGIK